MPENPFNKKRFFRVRSGFRSSWALLLLTLSCSASATYTGISLPGALDPSQVNQVTFQLPAAEPIEAVDSETCLNNLDEGEVCLPGYGWYVRTDLALGSGTVGVVEYLGENGQLLASGQVSTNAAGQLTNWLSVDLYDLNTGQLSSANAEGFSLNNYYSYAQDTYERFNSDAIKYVSPRISFGIDLSQSYYTDASLAERALGFSSDYISTYGSQLGIYNQPLPLVDNPQQIFHLPGGVQPIDALGNDYFIGSSLQLPDGSSLVGAYPSGGYGSFDNAWSVGVDYELSDSLDMRIGYDYYLEEIDCGSVQQGGGKDPKVHVRPPAPPVKDFVEGKEKPKWDPAKDGAKPPVRPVNDPEVEELIEEIIVTGARREIELADSECVRAISILDLETSSAPSTASTAPSTSTTTAPPAMGMGATTTTPAAMGTSTTAPIVIPPTTTPPLTADIAPITSSTVAAIGPNQCPYPTGRISVHMVDKDVYSAILYPGSNSFTDAADMLSQLRGKVAPRYDPTATCGRCIQNLEIWGHGSTTGGYLTFGPNDGLVSSNGKSTPLSASTTTSLQGVAALMCTNGSVTFNQCNGGKGSNGTTSLQSVADILGVPVSGPESTIKGCRIFGGALTSYKTQQPSSTATTPGSRPTRDVSSP